MSPEMRRVVVVDYDPEWPRVFEALRAGVWEAVRDSAVGIEHIGSTSVPGLAAKPIIDMAIIVASADQVPLVINRLAGIGYVHRGNLGIEKLFTTRPDCRHITSTCALREVSD
jgi:GrpB-like predicted nucleotidyltransferase (UPF0157 family)